MERLKKKVASSSSRVLASLQQVATTSNSATTTSHAASQQVQQISACEQQASQPIDNQAQTQPPPPTPALPEAAMSTSWLMAADATAHLTDEEKGILLEVFKKEEQFQRDTIKQLTAARAQQQQQQQQQQLNNSNKENYNNTSNTRPAGVARNREIGQLAHQRQPQSHVGAHVVPRSIDSSATPTCSSTPSSRPCSCATQSCGHATPTMHAPSEQQNSPMLAGPRQAQNPQDSQGKSYQPQQDFGQCRICRKTIGSSEPCHLCSNCNQFICDDCASYSAADQHWMCSSCRRRAMNPPIPAEALKELGLNQNSSAVRRMTLRLNQGDLKAAVNKCSSESSSSKLCSSSSQAVQSAAAGSHSLSSLKSRQQQQQQLQAARLASGNSSADGSPKRSPSKDDSLSRQQQAALAGASPVRTPSVVQRQREQSVSESGGSQAGGNKFAQQQRQQPRQPHHGSSSATPTSLTRVNSLQQKASAQKTMSQPTDGVQTRVTHQLHAASNQMQRQQQQQQPWSAEPEVKRPAQPVRHDSLGLRPQPQQQGVRRASVAAPVSPDRQPQQQYNQWPLQHQQQQPAQAHYQQPQAALPLDQHDQQLIRGVIDNRRSSMVFGAQHPHAYHGQQQPAQMPVHPQHQQHAQHQMVHYDPNWHGSGSLGPSPASMSRRGSYNQHAAPPPTQLIPIPPEQMHLRRLSDQSNLVRRSSIIANNFLDGASMARNRSHSNIDTVHYLHQMQQQQQQQQQQSGMFVSPRASHQHLHLHQQQIEQQQRQHHQSQQYLGHHQPAAACSSSTANLFYLQPNQGPGQAQLSQRRLSDGGQYFTHADGTQSARDQQQLSSIVTSYAQKHHSGGHMAQHRRQSSEDIHSDSSSDIGEPIGGLGASGYAAMDYQDENYHMHQPINIPSVSVSEFAAAAAARRSSIQQQQQQQQQQQDVMMAHYARDNQITPMQINVAIEQVIRQQQQQQQNQLGPDNSQVAYLMRRGSSGRVLPSIPGGQSRSLLELPHQGGGQTAGDQQLQHQSGLGHEQGVNGLAQNGAHCHSRNGSTAGIGQTTLDLPCTSPTLRRASAPEGQNIKIVVDDIDNSPFVGRAQNGALKLNHQLPFDPAHGHQMGNFYERHIIYRDDSLDPAGTHVGRGFGLQVTGGKLEPAGKLQACVTWVLPGGPADKVGLRAGDKIIEWDGKCLLDMSYEQVAEVIESSANIAELLVKPTPQRLSDPDQPPPSYMRSHRRLSQQTERDLRRHQQQQSVAAAGAGQQQVVAGSQQRRMSTAQMNGGGQSSGRIGTGRRLPQIPQAAAKSSEHTNRLGLAGSGGVCGAGAARHASTSQLDQPLTTSTSNLIYSQAAGSGGQFLTHSGNHLNTFHQAHDQQQQTRSANELNHRGSMVALSYQQQASLVASYAGGQQTSDHLAAGSWPMQQQQQQQQYGGSQQIIPKGGGQTYQMTSGYGHNINHNSTAASLTAGQPQEISGLIGLQVNVDERLATLEVSVLSAHNIERDLSQDYVVRVRILPDGDRFKICTTQPSADMNWKETFIFQNFPIQKVQRMALEIGIWVHDELPRLSAHMAQPICEALIPIQSARERNIDFWPMRPPPTSPQARRKSLNDLIGNHYQGPTSVDPASGDHHSTGYRQTPITLPLASGQVPPMSLVSTEIVTSGGVHETSKRFASPFGSQARVSSAGLNSDSPVNRGQYQRERSSSNRNLQDTNKLHVQPRRASDEVATSSSHRLLTRLSPAASRRSISVMNVGDGLGHAHAGGQCNRSPSSKSRLGSQANLLKAGQMVRRDSTSQAQQRDSPASGSPIKYASGSPSGRLSKMAGQDNGGQQAAHGYTPSGRRTSLAGMHSLAGYTSQKSSLSDATDHESPLNCGKRTREGSLVVLKPPSACGKSTLIGQPASPQAAQSTTPVQQPRQVSSGPTSTRPSCSSNSASRRGSTEQSSPAQLQRRGSFATQTLRKLRRTLSLNKGSDTSQPGSNQESRRSSSSSDKSHSDSVGEDLAIARPIRSSDTLVGRLKLSFIMTKGQFEVEVICGQGLMFDLDSATGIYVKLYLRGKNRSNKRRTRVVQPWEAPLFKQTIKYDASLVDNKLLEVGVWLKHRNCRSKQALGTTEVRLAELDLTRLQISWYNLRPVENLSSSSVDE